jgi:hypothetical protein
MGERIATSKPPSTGMWRILNRTDPFSTKPTGRGPNDETQNEQLDIG